MENLDKLDIQRMYGILNQQSQKTRIEFCVYISRLLAKFVIKDPYPEAWNELSNAFKASEESRIQKFIKELSNTNSITSESELDFLEKTLLADLHNILMLEENNEETHD